MRSRRIEKLFESYRTRGDGAALAAVFDATAPRLLELACHLVRDPSEAEDLVQSTFLAAIRHAQRYDASAPLEGWLYGILWREALKAKRRAARRVDPRDLDAQEQTEPVEALAAAELPQAVREALEKLPRHEREVLEPFLLEDLRADEIARKLERSAGTVRSQIHRALGRLRRNLPASLTPLAGVVPIRGLDVVRGEVLKAAGFPATTAAALVGGGIGSRVLLGAAALVLAAGGWVGVKLALKPAAPESTLLVAKVDAEPAAPTRVEADSSASQRAPGVAAVGTSATLTLTLVNWPKEHPVAGMHVEAWPGDAPDNVYMWPGHPYSEKSESPIAAGNTDAEGRLDLELPAGQPLHLALPWQGPESELAGALAPYRGKLLNLERLAPSEHKSLRLQVLYGWEFPRPVRILADEDGHALPEARVLCTGRAASGPAESVLATGPENGSRWRGADSSGSVELVLTYEQRFDTYFALLASGRTPLLTRLCGRVRGEEPPEYRLVRSASIAGVLVDDTRASHPPYRLRLTVAGHDLMQRSQDRVDAWDARLGWGCDTGPDGSFEFPDLPANARIDVKAFCGDKQVFWINGEFSTAPCLTPGESRKVDWHIGGGVPVRGLALDEDLQPVPNHEIWLLHVVIDAAAHPGPVALLVSDDTLGLAARTRTDDDGRFSFERVAPGTWWVGIAPPADSFNRSADLKPLPLAVEFQVPKDVPLISVTIRRKNTDKVSGTVIGPDGAPVAGASILLSKEVQQDFSDECGMSAADGKFEVVPAEGGKWWLGAWAPDSGLSYSEPIQVQGAQQGIVLKPVRSGSMSGEIVCPDCSHEQVLQIHFLGAEMGSMSDPQAFGAAHSFEFVNMRPGIYHLWAECEPDRVGWLRDIKVEPGAVVKDLRVELSKGGSVVVGYTGKEAECNFTLWLDGVNAGSMDVKKGKLLRVIVPPGVVKLKPDEGGAERVLSVKAGRETEVVLDDT